MNIKKILSDFSDWVWIFLTFLGFIIIYVGISGLENSTTKFYFIAVGVILILPFLIFILKDNISSNKAKDEKDERINHLIKSGEKVTVSLENLKIKSNNYQQEIEVRDGYESRFEYIEVNRNVVFIDIPYNGGLIKYKLNIGMDTTTLKMHFAIKKTTKLYIDPKNPDNHYLDLRFLRD